MKKGYVECPFCANEIKEWAIKCQYCKEMLNIKIWAIQWEKSKTYENINLTNECFNWLKVWLFWRLWSLIKLIFWIWEKRLSVVRGIIADVLWEFILTLCFLPFIDYPYNSEFSVMTIVFVVLALTYRFWYISVKRAHDRWESGWMVLVPFYNILLILLPWDKWENKYWMEPDFFKSFISILPENWWNKIKQRINNKSK